MRIYRIRKFPSKLFILLIIIGVIAFSHEVRAGLKNFAFQILDKPIEAISGITGYFGRIKNLSDENILLKERVGMLSVELARMKEIASENERLSLLMDFKERSNYKGTIAKIIARDSTDWRKSVIINKGKKHGIKAHMPCATALGLIGTVAEVGPVSSKVMLITDPNSRVGVVLDPSRESGLLVGFSEGEPRVIYLSLESAVKKGEKVLTAGFSAFFPEGLLVGEAVDIGVDKARLYKYAIVNTAENMGKLEEVICIDEEK